MNDDSISRQAVVDLVEELETQRLKGDIDLLYAPMIKGVRALPSAQPQWIPCSERLPAYGEDVLISIGGYCNVGHIVSVNEEERYNWYFSGWYHSPNDVDAWMPLPEPARLEEE